MQSCSRITSYNVCYTKLLREDLNAAGGIAAVLNRLDEKGLLFDSKSVTLATIKEIAAKGKVVIEDVIRTFDNPVHPTGGLAVLKGNIARNGCIVKEGAVSPKMLKHTGPAKVFESEEDTIEAIIVITSYSIHYTKLYETCNPHPE